MSIYHVPGTVHRWMRMRFACLHRLALLYFNLLPAYLSGRDQKTNGSISRFLEAPCMGLAFAKQQQRQKDWDVGV